MSTPTHIPTLAELRERLGDDTRALEDAATAARDAHNAAMRQIHTAAGANDLSASDSRRFSAHESNATELDAYVTGQRAARVADSRSRWGGNPVRGGSFDGESRSHVPGRDLALRHADTALRNGWLHAEARAKIGALVDTGGAQSRSIAAGWVAAAGDPAYRSAFAKIAMDPVRGHLEWTPEEHDAYRAVKAWQQDMAARTALTTSGYVLPVSLDPTVMLTNDGSNNPLRRLARVVTTTTSTWRGIKSTGAVAEWKAEMSEAADGTPPATEVEIPVFLADVAANYSYEVQQDSLDFLEQLTRVVSDAVDNLQAVAFTTGNGTTAPQGLVTGLIGGASELNTSGTEAIDKTDPTRLQAALGARFSANASWLSHIAIKNGYAFMETTNGALLFPELRNDPASLLGKPWYELSNMDGVINPAATANNYVLIYGDIRQAYTIVDRIGTTVEFLPGYGANGLPNASRWMFVTTRHGAEVVVPEAARILDVPTTA